MPPAACTNGSTTIAQTRDPSRASTARISSSTSTARAARVWPGLSTPGEPTIRVSISSGRYVAWNSSTPPSETAPSVSP